MEEDDLSNQVNEIEALSAIYGDEWCVLNAANRTYCIDIDDGKSPSVFKLNLQVTLPEKYPSTAPPQYQLNAPWLRGQDRLDIQSALEELYLESMGESIIYMWVEKIRELISGDKFAQNSQDVPQEDEEEDFTWDPSTMDQYTHYVKPTNSNTESENGLPMPEIHTGGFIVDRKSTFQPHLAAVTCKEQVDMVMRTLLQNKKIADATHNILAYRIIEEGKSVVLQGCHDDGETHAGSRMLHLLQIVDARNVMVVVTRWYGGIHLGPDRFKHINNCTRHMLVEHGYIQEKQQQAKKGKHKS